MNVNTENEHILVCLSSSPSNKNIIFTASKMANALQAQFTALYVQTGARIQSEDKERLDENIRFAEELGAEIVKAWWNMYPRLYCTLSGTRWIMGLRRRRKERPQERAEKGKLFFQQKNID